MSDRTTNSFTLRIAGGRVIDPASGSDEIRDLWVRDGVLIDPPGGEPNATIDAVGLVVCPGFVEPHAVAPTAGVNERFARQALAGGYTRVAAFGTARQARDFNGPCPKLLRIGPLTVPGTRRLAELGDAAEAGAVAFGDGPEPHGDSELLRRGLLYAKMLNRRVFDLPRDAELSEGGVAAEGPVAAQLGLFGVSAASERVAVRRGIELAHAIELADPSGRRLHFTALSDGGAAMIVSDYLNETLLDPAPISAAVTATHLLCTAAALEGFDPAGRVDPPFRDDRDREFLIHLAGEGRRTPEYPPAIACLTAGHRPDPALLDPVDLLAAPPGYEAFEIAFAAANTALGEEKLPRLIELLTTGPADVLDRQTPSLAPGERADLAVLDVAGEWTCDPATLAVPVARTPLAGRTLRGRVAHTVLGGRVVFERGRFPDLPHADAAAG
ncbi:dihydroorotase [Alienimonas chondri]|uniref:Dihydroorotase n=1 Tax=Alienimonas chondri TaxID=2681879 RepID=A0ABX1VE83_9PLAN|nr:hypothetical protein [Alienimonas chondri]NNJ26044.1 Dihydroorotase [Alienimonas chondri]